MLTLFQILSALGGVGLAAALVWALWERAGRIGADKDVAHLTNVLDYRTSELATAKANAADLGRQFREMQSRYEAAQKAFDQELGKLEEVLGACSDPAVLRRRWEQLFPRRPAAPEVRAPGGTG